MISFDSRLVMRRVNNRLVQIETKRRKTRRRKLDSKRKIFQR
jgi:hypothetical protein